MCCAGCPWSMHKAFVPTLGGDLFYPDLRNGPFDFSLFDNSISKWAIIAFLIEKALFSLKSCGPPADDLTPSRLLPIEQVPLSFHGSFEQLLSLASSIEEFSHPIAKKVRAIATTVRLMKGKVTLIPGRGPDLVIETLTLADEDGMVVSRTTVCRGSRSATQAHIFPSRTQKSLWSNSRVYAVVSPAKVDGSTGEFLANDRLSLFAGYWHQGPNVAFLASTNRSSLNHSTCSSRPLYELIFVPISRSGILDTRFSYMIPWSAKGGSPQLKEYMDLEDFQNLWGGETRDPWVDLSEHQHRLLSGHMTGPSLVAATAIGELAVSSGILPRALVRVFPMFIKGVSAGECDMIIYRRRKAKTSSVVLEFQDRSILFDDQGMRFLCSGFQFSVAHGEVSGLSGVSGGKVHCPILVIKGASHGATRRVIIDPKSTEREIREEITDICDEMHFDVTSSPVLARFIKSLASSSFSSPIDADPSVKRYQAMVFSASMASEDVVMPQEPGFCREFQSPTYGFNYSSSGPVIPRILERFAHDDHAQRSNSLFVRFPKKIRKALPFFPDPTYALSDMIRQWGIGPTDLVTRIAAAVAAGGSFRTCCISLSTAHESPSKAGLLRLVLMLARGLGIRRIIDPSELNGSLIESTVWPACPIVISSSMPTSFPSCELILFHVPGADCTKANAILDEIDTCDERGIDDKLIESVLRMPQGVAALLGGKMMGNVPVWELAGTFRDVPESWTFTFQGRKGKGFDSTLRAIYEKVMNRSEDLVWCETEHEEYGTLRLPTIPFSSVIGPRSGTKTMEARRAYMAEHATKQLISSKGIVELLLSRPGMIAVPPLP